MFRNLTNSKKALIFYTITLMLVIVVPQPS